MENPQNKQTVINHKPPWFLVGASMVLALIALYGFNLYSMVHSQGFRTAALVTTLDQIKIESDGRGLSEAKGFAKEVNETTMKLLSRLSAYRLFAVGSLVLAVWSGFRRPRWACLFALLPAVCAALASIAIQ